MSRSALLLLFFAGCAPPGPLALELGQGIDRFLPLRDGEEVELVMGPQGGWHIWTGVRVSGLDDAHATIELTVEHEGEREVSRLRPEFQPVGERMEAAGLTGIVKEPARVRGREVRLRARLDSDGRTAEDARTVRVR